MSQKKILVTGASGFIGNYVIAELLDRGYQVIASSRAEAGVRDKNWFPGVIYVPYDLHSATEPANLFSFFHEPDILIHLAWEGLPNYKDDFHIKDNLPRHITFLQNLISNGLRSLTVTGTCLEYGLQQGELFEHDEARPTTAYGIAKNELRKQLETFQKQVGFVFHWIRLFYMYGKGQNPKSLLSQLDRALADGQSFFDMSGGEQTRDFLPVEEVAKYIVSIALDNQVQGIVNCSSNKPVTVKQFVQDQLARRGKEIQLNLGVYPYADYEPMHFWGNNDKLKKILINE